MCGEIYFDIFDVSDAHYIRYQELNTVAMSKSSIDLCIPQETAQFDFLQNKHNVPDILII